MRRQLLKILITLNAGRMQVIVSMLFIGTINFISCKKSFYPEIAANNLNILVVEGAINTGGVDSTVIKLSRTGLVNNKVGANPESGATITVENVQGPILTLAEQTKGYYTALPIVLDNTKQYRLRIKISSGVIYLSDFVDVKITPPIDSIGYAVKSTGIQIYANTHDANNNTHYYKYSYGETWQFQSAYLASYIFSYLDTDLVRRTPAQQIHDCFGTDSSSHTIINSTAALSQDVAYQVPITTVDDTLEKLETKYSILVTQQALTKEAYAFYENLQKNTETLGSIFDAQPSQLIGNIHNPANPLEPVIGYISAGTKQQKRVYILKSALPQAWQPTYLNGCKVDTAYYYEGHDTLNNKLVPINPENSYAPFDYGEHPHWVELVLFPFLSDMLYQGRPYGEAIETFDDTVGYKYSTTRCTDCTIRGNITRPAFWK